MFTYEGLNWLAILVSTVVGFLIGGLWYGPLLGKAWMRAVGKTEEDLQGGGATPFVVSFFSGGATAVVLALIVNTLGLTTAGEGVLLGLYVGLGFIAAGMASDYSFCGWGVKLWVIQAGYRVVYSVVMGVILCLWR